MAPVIWGSLYLGGVVSPANLGYGVEELQHQLKNSGATVVVTQTPFLSEVLRAATNAGIAHGRVIVLPSAKSAYVSSLASPLLSDPHSALQFSSIVAEAKGRPLQATIGPRKDVAFLVYSSGT